MLTTRERRIDIQFGGPSYTGQLGTGDGGREGEDGGEAGGEDGGEAGGEDDPVGVSAQLAEYLAAPVRRYIIDRTRSCQTQTNSPERNLTVFFRQRWRISILFYSLLSVTM